MGVERVTAVLPVADLRDAVASWTTLLGVEATFVDGDRWAQFDVGPDRIALAGTDRASDLAGVMVKVSDLPAARAAALAAGMAVGRIERGRHELRCLVRSADGWPAILYGPRRDRA